MVRANSALRRTCSASFIETFVAAQPDTARPSRLLRGYSVPVRINSL